MPDFRILLRKILAQQGFVVWDAGSGTEALQILSQDFTVNLVLLDIGLPDIDGFEVVKGLEGIRQIRPELKIAIVTGSRDKNSILKGLSMKVDDYIIKPIDPSLLRQKISKLLRLENIESEFAEISCDFPATLAEVPISFHFHITSISEGGCHCVSLNKFIPGSSFAFLCEKLDEIIGERGFVFRARVDESEPISRVSDRFQS